MPKEQDRMPLNYVNQPPMIPHSVEGYQVTTNTNRCLQCQRCRKLSHHWRAASVLLDFMDSDGKVGAEGGGSTSLLLSAMSRAAG